MGEGQQKPGEDLGEQHLTNKEGILPFGFLESGIGYLAESWPQGDGALREGG